MQEIAVTGGTGFVGRHLVAHLAAADCRLRILSRTSRNDDSATSPTGGTRVVRGDLRDGRSLKTLVTPGSTVRVGKVRIEQRLREKAAGRFELATLRPTAVFGPGGRNLLTLLERIRRGRSSTNFLARAFHERRRFHLLPVQNLTAAIDFMIHAPSETAQGTYIVSDDDDPLNNYADVERLLRSRLQRVGRRNPQPTLPNWCLSFALRATGRGETDPARIDCGEKLRAAGFQRPVDLHSSLNELIDWYCGSPILSDLPSAA